MVSLKEIWQDLEEYNELFLFNKAILHPQLYYSNYTYLVYLHISKEWFDS